MRLSRRTAVVLFVAASSVALSVAPAGAHAQDGQLELRIDGFTFERGDRQTTFGLAVPGAAALAWYVNGNVAVESRVLAVSRRQTDGGGSFPDITETTIAGAVYVPIHFADTRGRRGLFIAPGVIVRRTNRSVEGDRVLVPATTSTTDFAFELGFKHTLKGRVSWRHALSVRAGDGQAAVYGATSGVSVFFR